MRDQGLRDQIAALFRCAPGERRLGDEPPGPIADAVLGLVGPLLAEKDAEARSLAKSWDQRLSDVQAEYVKHLESWDRTRERLTAELAQTRGKLGEAQGNHWAAREQLARVEASRRDWAAEAIRLDMTVEVAMAEVLKAVTGDIEAEAAFRAPVGLADPNEISHEDLVAAQALREYAERLRTHPSFSRPVCAVHPEGGEVE